MQGRRIGNTPAAMGVLVHPGWGGVGRELRCKNLIRNHYEKQHFSSLLIFQEND